jgi:hypothetical protein
MRTTLTTMACALAALALAAPTIAAGGRPHVVNFQYSQDYEGIGRHYTVGAVIKGDAESVQARLGALKVDTRLAGHISVGNNGRLWLVEDHDFVSALRHELKETGGAVVAVKAVGQSGVIRKRCALTYQPDPQFGDYADGPCRRVG